MKIYGSNISEKRKILQFMVIGPLLVGCLIVQYLIFSKINHKMSKTLNLKKKISFFLKKSKNFKTLIMKLSPPDMNLKKVFIDHRIY